MNPELQQFIETTNRRLSAVEALAEQPTHYHNGFDSNNIAWGDLVQRKVWLRWTLPGTSAATAGNYGTFFIVPMTCLVTKIQEVHEVLGTSGSAVTLNIEKLTGTTVPGSGLALLSTGFNLKGTINTVLTGTLVIGTTISYRSLAMGDRLGLQLTGTPTSVAGVTVHVELTF